MTCDVTFICHECLRIDFSGTITEFDLAPLFEKSIAGLMKDIRPSVLINLDQLHDTGSVDYALDIIEGMKNFTPERRFAACRKNRTPRSFAINLISYNLRRDLFVFTSTKDAIEWLSGSIPSPLFRENSAYSCPATTISNI